MLIKQLNLFQKKILFFKIQNVNQNSVHDKQKSIVKNLNHGSWNKIGLKLQLYFQKFDLTSFFLEITFFTC